MRAQTNTHTELKVIRVGGDEEKMGGHTHLPVDDDGGGVYLNPVKQESISLRGYKLYQPQEENSWYLVQPLNQPSQSRGEARTT